MTTNSYITLTICAVGLLAAACNQELPTSRTVHVLGYETERAAVDVYLDSGDLAAVATPKDDPSVEIVERFDDARLDQVTSVAEAPQEARLQVAATYAAGVALTALEDEDQFRAADCGLTSLDEHCTYAGCETNWCISCSYDGYWWGECWDW